ncbi:MAG: hypothetical protein F6K24_56385, partial [Okeania sp. SIO2D1]|nr:hypothetical protein [Okeania sp. SIO2D1]
ESAVVEQLVDELAKAKRPIILAGNGCIRTRASRSLRDLCEKTGIGLIYKVVFQLIKI